MVLVIQALIILFTGALDNMVRMPLERLFLALGRKRRDMGEGAPLPRATTPPDAEP